LVDISILAECSEGLNLRWICSATANGQQRNRCHPGEDTNLVQAAALSGVEGGAIEVFADSVLLPEAGRPCGNQAL
jgi:hypothetical protein